MSLELHCDILLYEEKRDALLVCLHCHGVLKVCVDGVGQGGWAGGGAVRVGGVSLHDNDLCGSLSL